ncbi:hypothetical protein CAPTEDRAFT_195114 [Capitella teleta]|uniref:TLC domain-containing protein n=1 Tax=Capitella teleta TaxID=283909 RepID=R7UWL0_CAPTE|nr:hypothetical protein CAPTEDRAFT_195114 [Capitella teleta]|eukprot:ELU08327.1 hypothetical protein CAPTEDRAFT_195114 [Capitella teleta]
MTLFCVCYYSLTWTVIYSLLCWFFPKRSREWHCREVTALHALTVVSMSAWCGFIQGPWPLTDPGGASTPLQHWTCATVLGYFTFDLIWCLSSGTEGVLMLFHHALSITGALIVLVRGTCGTEMIATIFGSEFTNPLLQLRWFLKQSRLHATWFAEIVDAAFVIIFGVMRILIGSILLYVEWTHPRPDMVAKIGGTAIYLVGWVFWYAIVRYAIRKYSKKPERNRRPGALPS